LICPLNFDTVFSAMNIAKLSDDADVTINRVANAVIPMVTTRPGMSQPAPYTQIKASSGILSVLTDPETIAAIVWLAGMIAIMVYLIKQTVRLTNALKTAKFASNGGYYVSDMVDTSFVLGVIRPRIYMQSGLTRAEEAYILQHERMHVRNFDHITRIMGILTLCVHWFNPFVWIAFVKMCADLEMRCDEAVIDRMGDKIRKDYCRSMVRHALKRGTAGRGVYAAFAGDNYSGREIRMRIKNLTGYKKISKIAAMFVLVFALGLTIALSTKAQNNTEEIKSGETTAAQAITMNMDGQKEGAPVSTPGNLLLNMTPEENLENYGKEKLEIPDDVVYSDEGRPYSKTYDYRDTPVLNKLGSIFEKEGFEILDPDTEYLDKEGNIQTGRELYTLNVEKEDDRGSMLINVYMVSEEYARDSFSEIKEKNGIWYYNFGDWGSNDGWCVIRLYDPKTGVMIDASGNYELDWEAMGLFD
ncbi:MAG: M56 family metallopeptidase, partial [Lachnospiraceae bacterium]|nr:M56 family metallopeptidase [Lachnospiraceae bacterium]